MRVVLFVREWAVGDRVEVVFAALRVPLAVPRLTGLPPVASSPKKLFEEYSVPSAVSRGSLGSEKSARKGFCT